MAHGNDDGEFVNLFIDTIDEYMRTVSEENWRTPVAMRDSA